MFHNTYIIIRQPLRVLSIVLTMLVGALMPARGQVQPPRPISVSVNPAQPLSFGAFFHGPLGGTVIVLPNGTRSVTGDVGQASLGFVYSPALFEVEGLPGTVVSILNGPDVTLHGSNGGTMNLHIGSSSPSSPFIIATTPPSRTLVNIGGTLTVGGPSANPPGAYSGTFNITFMEQ